MPVQAHHTFQNAATSTGDGTALLVRGATMLSADITFTGTAVATWEGRLAAGTWRTLPTMYRGNFSLATSFASTGHYLVDVYGIDEVRCRISSYSSGTVTANGMLLNDPRPFVQHASIVTGATISGVVGYPAAAHYMSSTNAVPVTATDGLPVGKTTTAQATLTRPNDTTAYAAGDAVTDSTSAPTALTFTSCARANGGGGAITGATLLDSANQATKGQFELWLFAGSAAPTPDNDNAVFTPTDAELANFVGVLPFTTAYVGDATSGAGGNAVYHTSQVALPFKCNSATTSLFGLVVVRNAYTPVAQEALTFTLFLSQD